MNVNQILAVAAAAVAALGAEARSALPVGYQEMEYFTSFKTTVKTGYTPEVTDQVETKILVSGLTSGRGVFCARGTSTPSDPKYSTFTCYANAGSKEAFSVRLDFGDYNGDRLLKGFKGGEPASLQSTDFIRRARGLIIVVE